MRLKNDKVDARTLAHLLRTDLLPEAWIAPAEVRELRVLLRHRAGLVGMRTSLKVRVRAVLGERGISAPAELWSRPGRGWLAAVELSATHRLMVDNLCRLLDGVDAVLSDVESEIRRRAKPDERVEALMGIPGVGLITAMTLIAEIGDVHRFPTARKLCSWSGLTPRVRNSDTTMRHESASKMGPPVLRWVLGEAAHVAKRTAPYEPTFVRIAARRGKNIATMAIARRLLARAFTSSKMWKRARSLQAELVPSSGELELFHGQHHGAAAVFLTEQPDPDTIVMQPARSRACE